MSGFMKKVQQFCPIDDSQNELVYKKSGNKELYCKETDNQ